MAALLPPLQLPCGLKSAGEAICRKNSAVGTRSSGAKRSAPRPGGDGARDSEGLRPDADLPNELPKQRRQNGDAAVRRAVTVAVVSVSLRRWADAAATLERPLIVTKQ